MAQNATPSKRPQIAVFANTYKYHLHTQHIVDRILDGYGYGGVHHHPVMDVVRAAAWARNCSPAC